MHLMKKGELEVTSAVMKVRTTSRVYSIWPVIVMKVRTTSRVYCIWPVIVQTYSFIHGMNNVIILAVHFLTHF